MKKSLYPEPSTLSASDIDAGLEAMRKLLADPQIVSKNLEPGIGISPEFDQLGNLTGFQSMGDPYTAKTTVEVFKLFGQEVSVPIVSNKYAVPSTVHGGKEVIKTFKTFGFNDKDVNDIQTVLESCAEAIRLVSFIIENIEIPMRGLLPELKSLPSYGTYGPIFGEGYLSTLLGISHIGANSEMLKEISNKAGNIQAQNVFLRASLRGKESIFKFMLDVVNNTKSVSDGVLPIIDPINYTPTNTERVVNVIKTTVATKPEDIYSGLAVTPENFGKTTKK